MKKIQLNIFDNFDLVQTSVCDNQGRAGTKNDNCKWPGGVVPFQFYNGPEKKYVYTVDEKKIVIKVA